MTTPIVPSISDEQLAELERAADITACVAEPWALNELCSGYSIRALIARLRAAEADNRSKNGSMKAFGEQIGKLQRAVKNRDRIIRHKDAQIDHLRAAEKDAARYLWFREPASAAHRIAVFSSGDLDKAVDAAMEQSK